MKDLARGIAAFLGLFSLLNIAGGALTPGFDATHWWVRLDALPHLASTGFLIVASAFLIAFACNPRMTPWRRGVTAVLTALLIAAAVTNAATFYLLAAQSIIQPAFWLPLSLPIALALGLVLRSFYTKADPTSRMKNSTATFAVALACAFVFPAAHMVFFGKTDYRRPADAAVVFGCRAYADGRPSDALADRVRTACGLYLDGTVSKLIFSGGPGDGSVHETEAMRRMATALGVKDSDILLDADGLSTQATVQNTAPLFREQGFRRVLAVSHFFHLPRIKMAYQRRGLEVYTVPAKESYLLRQMPFLIARETAAWWVYYARPLTKHVTPTLLSVNAATPLSVPQVSRRPSANICIADFKSVVFGMNDALGA